MAEARGPDEWGGGNRGMTIVEPTKRIETDYGSDFNDRIVAVRVRPGPNFSGESVRLHRDPDFKGGSITIEANSVVTTLGQHNFSGVTSSIEFVRHGISTSPLRHLIAKKHQP
jgi:hypothetical protein